MLIQNSDISKSSVDYFESKDSKKLKKPISKTLKGDFLDHIMVLDAIACDFHLLTIKKPDNCTFNQARDKRVSISNNLPGILFF